MVGMLTQFDSKLNRKNKYTSVSPNRYYLTVDNFLQLVNKLQQTCQFHQVPTSLLKSGLLQLIIYRLVTTLVETTCSKPVDNKFRQSTCNKSVDNLQQTCRQQAVASHANAS